MIGGTGNKMDGFSVLQDILPPLENTWGLMAGSSTPTAGSFRVDSSTKSSKGLLQARDRAETWILTLIFTFSLPYCSDYTCAQSNLTGARYQYQCRKRGWEKSVQLLQVTWDHGGESRQVCSESDSLAHALCKTHSLLRRGAPTCVGEWCTSMPVSFFFTTSW